MSLLQAECGWALFFFVRSATLSFNFSNSFYHLALLPTIRNQASCPTFSPTGGSVSHLGGCVMVSGSFNLRGVGCFVVCVHLDIHFAIDCSSFAHLPFHFDLYLLI